MLTVWGRPNSHNVKKVMWLVDELGLPHVRHDVGGAFGMDTAYLAKNPNALIPTIEEDGLTLWESNACLRYIAARHGGEKWWPADPAVRAVGTNGRTGSSPLPMPTATPSRASSAPRPSSATRPPLPSPPPRPVR